jgi:glycerophosphoryl diester phosphodiesterase
LTDIYAHRGSAHVVRENTVAAFVAARELGADGVELDVHLSADGMVVVNHDDEILGLGLIGELLRSQLPEWLPTLEEALEACRPLPVNVEIKAAVDPVLEDQLAAGVVEVVTARGEARDVVVSSFSLAAVDAVRAREPALATALLVEPAEDPEAALEVAIAHGHGGVHPFFAFVDEALMEKARASGTAVRPWTVDDPERMVELARLGVDAIITNDVALARRVLGR